MGKSKKAGRPKGSRSDYKCGECGEKGHSKRTCPSLAIEPEGNGVDDTVECSFDPETGEVIPVAPKDQLRVAQEALREAEEEASVGLGGAHLEQVLERVRDRWGTWVQMVAQKADVQKEAKESLEAAKARFELAIEDGTPLNGGPKALVAKLHKAESCWQNWKEEIARWKDEKGMAKDAVADAAKGLREAIENSRQMDLPLGG